MSDETRLLEEIETLRHAHSIRATRLGTLARLGRLVTSSLDMTEVLAAITRAAAEIANAPFASFWLASEDTETLTLGATSDDTLWADYPLKSCRFNQGLIGLVAKEKVAISVPDVFRDGRIVGPDWFRRHNFKSYYGIPLLFHHSVLGVLSLHGTVPFRFEDDERELLDGFAAQAAVAIRNVRLFEEVSKARDFLHSIADSSADAIITTDSQGFITYFSPGAEDLFKVPAAQMVGRPVADFYPGGREEARALMRRLAGEGRIRNYDMTLRNGADSIEVSTSYSLLKDSGGNVVGVLGVSTDISERRRAARALQETEGRYRSLVESSIQGIWIHTEFVIRFANQAAARIFGFDTTDQLLGIDVRDLAAPQERDRLARYQEASLRGASAPIRYDFEAVRKDGTPIWIEHVASTIPWNGEAAILATLLDITELKRAEQALRDTEEQLRQAQKMEAVGRLAGGVAHDFNNLLTVIGGRTDRLLESPGLSEAMCRDLELIRKTVTRAATLTRQLLTFSRRQVVQPQVVDLNAIILGLDMMLRRLLGEDIELVIAPANAPQFVIADSGQLGQVILNLAVNARDAMPEGGRLIIEAEPVSLDEAFAARHEGFSPGAYVMLAVSDTGCGIPAQVLPHIFEPFFSTKGPDKGTGLGLSTVYGIVKQNGGAIFVYSEVGLGTTFKIYLPRAGGTPAIWSDSSTARTPSPRGSETILLAEDENDVRELTRETLEANGYRVLSAGHPDQALRIAERYAGPIHLLLTDIVMPKMNGRELAERVVAARPGIEVLFVSGYTNAAISHRKELAGGAAFLEKPFMPGALLRKVRAVLGDGTRGGGG